MILKIWAPIAVKKSLKLAQKPCFWVKNEVFGQEQISANIGKVNYFIKYVLKYVYFYAFQ